MRTIIERPYPSGESRCVLGDCIYISDYNKVFTRICEIEENILSIMLNGDRLANKNYYALWVEDMETLIGAYNHDGHIYLVSANLAQLRNIKDMHWCFSKRLLRVLE